MMTEIKDLTNKIDKIIRQEKWFDFRILKYDGNSLTIAGGVDLIYYHTLEVIFEDVFFMCGFFNGWHSDTTSTVFFADPDNETELNQRYEIEQDYKLFVFKTEDYRNDVTIAAKKLNYNTDLVFHYHRQDLKENERIADFVKM